jgi:hypothetical protein
MTGKDFVERISDKTTKEQQELLTDKIIQTEESLENLNWRVYEKGYEDNE